MNFIGENGMDRMNGVILGSGYSKKDLAQIFSEPNIALVREGIYTLPGTKNTFLFVDLEKEGKEERFHFDDFFQGEFFHWDSQTTQHPETPLIKEIFSRQRRVYLFARERRRVKSKTQPFIYCGELEFIEYEKGTSRPVHMVFRSIDYVETPESKALMRIYLWRPEKANKLSKTQIDKSNRISVARVKRYTKPNTTERKGLVTSRVGQGYFRQQVIDSWDGKCPVTGCGDIRLLIASHIVPWSESTENERLDVNNGILLSPNIDALFDSHLISFSNEGQILLSDKTEQEDLKALGVHSDIKIKVPSKARPYLEKHRRRFYDKN
ncbi:DUF3427 domain-containing protein [Cryomorphaceae bacterium]|nr:DUF3427 domain-containing protein [Cryomorphaceae bacterium]